MKQVYRPGPSDRNFLRQLTRLRILLVFGALLAIIVISVVPTEILLRSHPAIVIYLFKIHDVYFIGLFLALLIWLQHALTKADFGHTRFAHFIQRMAGNRYLGWSMACATLAICIAGTLFVFEFFTLSLDEFFVDFVAQSILAGHLLAPLDQAWREFATALQPSFMQVSADGGFWSPLWRPGNAMIVALFGFVGLGEWTHAILAAACLPLVAILAKHFWPGDRLAPILAMVLLALSPQFLITGMTRYAMTTHLLFGLIWLVLFLRDTKVSHAGAAMTGFFAIGIHHIHVHPMFVMPFMLQLLRDRRWRLAGFYACWYSFSLLVWFFWRDLVEILQQNKAVNLSDFGYLTYATRHYLSSHGVIDILYWAVNIFRFLTWQSFALIVLFALGMASIRHGEKQMKNLAWAIGFSLLPYILLMPSQGHGWGYRFLHPLLANFALIAVHGWIYYRSKIKPEMRARFAAAMIIATLIYVSVALPVRMLQARNINHPFAIASEHLAQLDSDIILIDHQSMWFGQNFIRNDPMLRRRPKILAIAFVDDNQLSTLCTEHEALFFGYTELKTFGIMKSPMEDAAELKRRNALIKRLKDHGCSPLTSPNN